MNPHPERDLVYSLPRIHIVHGRLHFLQELHAERLDVPCPYGKWCIGVGVNLSPLRLADEPSQWTKCGNNNFEHWGTRCIAIPFREHDLVQRTLAEEGPSDSKVNIGPRVRRCSYIYDSVRCRRTRRANSALLRSGSRPDDSTNGCSRKRSSSVPIIIDPLCQTLLLFQVEVKHPLLVCPSPRTDRSRTRRSLLR